MRAIQIVDAKIVRADADHPLATYEAGEILEGPAAELQVALGHAYALPELPAVAQVEEQLYDASARPQEAPALKTQAEALKGSR